MDSFGNPAAKAAGFFVLFVSDINRNHFKINPASMNLRDFRNILLMVLSSVFITVVVPGIFSALGGTFYQNDIRAKISPEQMLKLNAFERETSVLDSQIKFIDQRLHLSAKINSNQDGLTIEELLKLRSQLDTEKATIKPPINLIPYYLNPQMLLWLGIYTAFFILIYLLRKEHKTKLAFNFKTFRFSILVYAFYEWPLWIRNFVLSSKGRTVYAYPNYDIDKYSYFCQEGIIFCFCLLTTLLIEHSLRVSKGNHRIEDNEDDNQTNKFLIISSYYSAAYKNWFINSVILALGFLSFTGFFWRLVFAYGDQRYILSALNAHVLWALCWIALSLNLLRFMKHFEQTKREILRNNPDDKTLKIVMEHQPANNLTLIISGFASLLTFLLPILKTLLN